MVNENVRFRFTVFVDSLFRKFPSFVSKREQKLKYETPVRSYLGKHVTFVGFFVSLVLVSVVYPPLCCRFVDTQLP